MAEGTADRSAASRITAGRVIAAMLAGLAVMLASACAAIPDGGPVTSAAMAQKGDQHDVFVQLLPAGPQPGWGPDTIVSGFLLASASFAGDNAVARQYLTPAAAKTWQPRSSVTEFAQTPMPTANVVVEANDVTVQATGTELGTINQDGQYRAAQPGPGSGPWNFTVVHEHGQWRISDLPDTLLLSKADVDRTFRSRDLYFYDPLLSVLVPDPVFVPAEATAQQLVARLVDALRQGPQGWLAGATKTAFPRGTNLLGTSVNGNTATVNLGGAVAATGGQQRDQMAAQLVQTLASVPAYQQPDVESVQSVVFEINGMPVRLSCATGVPPTLQFSQCGGPVPQTPSSRAYYIDSKDRVAMLYGSRSDSPVPGPAGTGGYPAFDRIAVSPDQLSVAGVAGGVVYTGGLTQNASLQRALSVTSVSAISWDSAGGLWVAGQSGGQAGVWRLDQGIRSELVAGIPEDFGPVTALRVAPDGVRIAIVTGSGADAHLWLAAIKRAGSGVSLGTLVPIGTDIDTITDLTWYDPGDLIVLTRPATGGPQLYEVPVDGGQSRPIATDPHTVAITAASDQLVAGLSVGTLVQLPDPTGSVWRPPSADQSEVHGRSPVYPG